MTHRAGGPTLGSICPSLLPSPSTLGTLPSSEPRSMNPHRTHDLHAHRSCGLEHAVDHLLRACGKIHSCLRRRSKSGAPSTSNACPSSGLRPEADLAQRGSGRIKSPGSNNTSQSRAARAGDGSIKRAPIWFPDSDIRRRPAAAKTSTSATQELTGRGGSRRSAGAGPRLATLGWWR